MCAVSVCFYNTLSPLYGAELLRDIRKKILSSVFDSNNCSHCHECSIQGHRQLLTAHTKRVIGGGILDEFTLLSLLSVEKTRELLVVYLTALLVA